MFSKIIAVIASQCAHWRGKPFLKRLISALFVNSLLKNTDSHAAARREASALGVLLGMTEMVLSTR